MGKTYDSEEVFVAIASETNNPECQTVTYAGHDEKLAVASLQKTHPGNYDYAVIQRWKDGEKKYTKEYSISQQVKVVEV